MIQKSCKIELPVSVYKILKALKNARVVGGCVRNYLLNLPLTDIDICTPLTPQEVIRILVGANIKVIPTGILYGTITAVIDEESFEITTLRRDVVCDGRRAVVEFSDDFYEDALRRDFTINALSYDPQTELLYDYCGGLEDLKAKKIKFIGNPRERIMEDSLRILRFFRFWSIYSESIDKNSYLACIDLCCLIKSLSKERIVNEFDKILMASKPEVLECMRDYGVLDEILGDNLYFRLEGLSGSLSMRYTILLMENNRKDVLQALQNLKLSRKLIIKILDFYKFIHDIIEDPDKIPFYIKYNCIDNAKAFEDYIALAMIFVGLQEDSIDNLRKIVENKGVLPVDGNMLLEMGFNGKFIGEVLRELKILWAERDFQVTEEEFKAILLEKNLSVS